MENTNICKCCKQIPEYCQGITVRDAYYDSDSQTIDVEGAYGFDVENYGNKTVMLNNHTTIKEGESRSYQCSIGIPFTGQIPISWGSEAGSAKVIVQLYMLKDRVNPKERI
jgi:hypothetical protein